MYCEIQGVYRNEASVYICTDEVVEYGASENISQGLHRSLLIIHSQIWCERRQRMWKIPDFS